MIKIKMNENIDSNVDIDIFIYDIIDNIYLNNIDVHELINKLKYLSNQYFDEENVIKYNFKYSENHIKMQNFFNQTIEYYSDYNEKNKQKISTFLKTWIKNYKKL